MTQVIAQQTADFIAGVAKSVFGLFECKRCKAFHLRRRIRAGV